MFEQHRWPRLAWTPIAAGGLWLWFAGQSGPAGYLLALPIGGLLLGAGVSHLMWPGDARIPQTSAVSGLLGVFLAPIAAFAFGLWAGLLLLMASGAAFVVSGQLSVQQEPHLPGVPKPIPSPVLAAKVAFDDLVLGFEQFATSIPMDGTVRRVQEEVTEARARFDAKGFLEKPERYHERPPALEDPRIVRRTLGSLAYERLSFESGYRVDPDEPGAARWMAIDACRTGYAYVLRHADGPRPWLVCTNGYRMGHAATDVRAFEPLHRRQGLNLLIPVLPLHGPRVNHWRSGEGFIGVDVLDTLHAEAQAMWDARRLISWVRAQEATAIGLYGLSLGGYTTALLSCFEDDLAAVIAGIPAADFVRLVQRHGPRLQVDYLWHAGLAESAVRDVLSVVSPLVLKTKVPHAHRLLFGGVADRLVTPDHVRDLAAHWDDARLVWYQGGHLSFFFEPAVRRAMNETLRASGLDVSGAARQESGSPPARG